jgi:hypothetical protein
MGRPASVRRPFARRLFATLLGATLAASLLPGVPAPSVGAADVAPAPESAENMTHVANLGYEHRYGQTENFGTDLELASMTVRRNGAKRKLDVAFAGTYRNGLQIIDVTRPARPKVLSVYDCAIAQGDVQVFRRGKRTLVAYTADDISSQTDPSSRCFRDAGISTKEYGTFIVDVTNPRRPKSVTFIPLERGSHNQTVHPSGNYLYNSNSDVVPGAPPSIEVIDIRRLQQARRVTDLPLGTGLDSHDITFNRNGTRAFSAAISHTLVIDTTDPAEPEIIGRIVDPSINIHHQSDPVTVDDPVLGKRRFLVVTDELAGAAGNGACPGGGLHVYDITGDLERAPVKVGFFDIPDVSVTDPSGSLRCTSHVLKMHPKKGVMTIAWYARGVRVIDISGLVGVSAGLPGAGMQEIGHIWFADSDTWAAKALRVKRNGSMVLFANDISRGFDVFRFTASPEGTSSMSTGASRWMSPAEARSALGVADRTGDLVVSCLLNVT